MATTSTPKARAVGTKINPVRRSTRSAPSAVAQKAAPIKGATKLPARKVAVKPVTKTVAAKRVTTRAKAAPLTKGQKPASPKKIKLVRDSFSFPSHEHALLAALKKRALKLGREFKKSEILRAGIAHLTSLADAALVATLSKVERVKTGRPAKKKKKK